ncbi:prolipoprotein diacylglyceryl transferase [Candidatus Dojkabacteria bacterium]|uniref:Phosphatidylglycerol--prolipoprotein diacylglyceryl transferase n=1 Tax=Candidatus Dojkabacteria bacterium TaxID=2099670 RepID=A0A955L901_9BACT|nr:prolipoprotein diacylglyceryl transferase [Candidatus Dojkabacteria bacterium]
MSNSFNMKVFEKFFIKHIKAIVICAGIAGLILFLGMLRGYIAVPNAITIGPLELRLYGFVIALGMVVVIELVKRHAPFVTEEHSINGLFWVIIPGIIGARMWHVASEYYLYSGNFSEVFAIWHGGLSIFGAMVGGIIGGGAYAWKEKLPIVKTLEYIALFFPIGHAIGRFGNFFNQEIFGPPTNLPWGVFIEKVYRPMEYADYDYFHPAFLYEVIGNFIIFSILYSIYKRSGVTGSGEILAWYIMLYGIMRYILSFIRLDPDAVTTMSFVTSAGMVGLGLIMIIILNIWKYKCAS